MSTEASLARAAGVAGGSCVAFVGGGGKTTAMLQMGRELAAQGARVLVTTTTKIWPPAGLPVVCSRHEHDVDTALRMLFGRTPLVALGESLASDGKLHGISPDLVCDLHSKRLGDVILCEADGAAGRPLKLHRRGEPVVPDCCTTVAIVAGMDAVGRPPEEVIHRSELFADIADIAPPKILGPGHVAEILISATRYVPSGAEIVFLLNKVDGEHRLSAANRVTEELRWRGVRQRILLSSSGRALAPIAAPAGRPLDAD